jgi:hypothetical protein
MVLVLMVAIGMAVFLAISGQIRAEREYARALREFRRLEVYWNEGRVPADRLMAASERLLTAECTRHPRKETRIASMIEHLARLEHVLRQERQELCCHGQVATIAELAQLREETRERLAHELKR